MTYDQAIELGEIERKVENYIFINYTNFGKISGRKGILKSSWQKIKKLAVVNCDADLSDLCVQYHELETKYKK